MTQEELEKDLLNKLDIKGYFKDKLFKNEEEFYKRRTFGDLFKYYRRYKVTEKMLIKALINNKMGGKICAAINRVVFCGISIYEPIGGKIFSGYNLYYLDWENKNIIPADKYTPEYLDNLLEN